ASSLCSTPGCTRIYLSITDSMDSRREQRLGYQPDHTGSTDQATAQSFYCQCGGTNTGTKGFNHMIRLIFAVIVCLPSGFTAAESPRQECLGRLTFDVPEEMEWATYDAERTFRISSGGGHNFTSKVAAKGDLTSYDFNGVVIRVSDIVERSEFEAAAGYQKGTGMRYQKQLQERLETNKRRLAKLPGMGYGPEELVELEQTIKDLEAQIPNAIPREHDLGIPDAHFLGGDFPGFGYVYRNQRVYYFAMRQGAVDGTGAEAFKDLMARFRPRELYEVPEGPGICFPYGFIADDGKTAYSIKNSLRFTSTPM